MPDLSLFTHALSFIAHIDVHLYELIARYGTLVYFFLFLIIFCETGLVITPFLPGDSLLFATGALAGAGYMSYPISLILLLTAAILGDAANYEIGRHLGPAIFSRDLRFLKKEYLLRAQSFYEKYGGKAIMLARFIPILRTFAPFVAGVATMRPTRFFLFNILGAAVWVIGLLSAGYFLGNIPLVKNNFSLAIYTIIVLSLLPPLAEYLAVRRAKTDKPSREQSK